MTAPLQPDNARASARPPSSFRRAFALATIRIGVVIAVLLASLRWTGAVESLGFFHPLAETFVTPAGFEDVEFTTADGVKLHAWFMPALASRPGQPMPCVLHVHGNQGCVTDHASWSEFLTDHGISVMVFDYRSFGRSQDMGRWLTREHLLTDTTAAYTYLKNRKDVDPHRIGVYGMSLGGAFALKLAAEHPEIKSVCTLGTFSSWPRVASDKVPILGHLLIRSGLAQSDSAAQLGTCELLVIHGDRDGIVPVYHARAIAAAARDAHVNVTEHIVKGAGHLNILRPQYDTIDTMTSFFVRTLGATQDDGASTR